jgi:hypothetical protein
MEPLQSVPVATHGVLIGINTANSWPVRIDVPTGSQTVRLAYIASNSTQRLSFVSLQSATHPADVLRVASRPSRFDDLPEGLVIEVYLAKDLVEGDAVHLSLAQAGATIYYPPQQIDDVK